MRLCGLHQSEFNEKAWFGSGLSTPKGSNDKNNYDKRFMLSLRANDAINENFRCLFERSTHAISSQELKNSQGFQNHSNFQFAQLTPIMFPTCRSSYGFDDSSSW